MFVAMDVGLVGMQLYAHGAKLVEASEQTDSELLDAQFLVALIDGGSQALDLVGMRTLKIADLVQQVE